MIIVCPQVQHASSVNELDEGLSAAKKSLLTKWIYDDSGSELFCTMMENLSYYPTKCEIELLKGNKVDLLAKIEPAVLNDFSTNML